MAPKPGPLIMNLPPTNNINGVLLNDQPSAPSTYQAQVSMQQAGKSQEVQDGTSNNQRIAMVQENMRRAAATQDTAEGKAKAMVALGAATIQQMANSGQAKLALAQAGDPMEVARRIYG